MQASRRRLPSCLCPADVGSTKHGSGFYPPCCLAGLRSHNAVFGERNNGLVGFVLCFCAAQFFANKKNGNGIFRRRFSFNQIFPDLENHRTWEPRLVFHETKTIDTLPDWKRCRSRHRVRFRGKSSIGHFRRFY